MTSNGETPPKAPKADNGEHRSSRSHRRTASEDLGVPNYYQYPPTQIWYNPSSTPPNDGQMRQQLPAEHNRTRSWSASQPYPGMPGPFPPTGMPPPTFSPSGNPIVPMLLDPSQNGNAMLPPQYGSYSSSRHTNQHGGGGGHRRVRSYSGPQSYGSFPGEMPPPGPPTGPPPPLPSGRRSDFSPRSEIMKLAGGSFRGPTGSISPRRSPNDSYHGMPPSPVLPTPTSLRGSFHFPDDPRVSFSPRTPVEGGLGVYGMDGATPGMVPGLQVNTPRSDTGGEAVFLAQKKTKHHRGSSRKMHMRQRSAQLFMEDVKGVEQQPKCRDLIFLLLFVFHLLGIVYLGNTYGYEALRFHDEMESEGSVTIIYNNVIYISCVSGIVAILISALALALMTAIARKIVQIALILTITLSFAWGTIGIGLSPKKVVPATGIFALALSVAYAIIVWDRIPFAAANLNTGLSGIHANPGAVLIAFFFQFLALGWSIYYTYVVVGVYDAVQVGDIDVGMKGMRIFIYVALGISYYWTLHVFLVRCRCSCFVIITLDPVFLTQDVHRTLSKLRLRASLARGGIPKMVILRQEVPT